MLCSEAFVLLVQSRNRKPEDEARLRGTGPVQAKGAAREPRQASTDQVAFPQRVEYDRKGNVNLNKTIYKGSPRSNLYRRVLQSYTHTLISSSYQMLLGRTNAAMY